MRNLSFTSGINYFAGGDGTIETREQSAGFGVFFENGASFNVGANRTFDRLGEPFQIRSDISIPEGDYGYDDFFVSYNTDPSRAIAGNIRYTVGEFWDGRRSSFSGSLDLKPDYHLNIDLNYSLNRVRLAGGSFTTNLLGTRVLYAVSSKIFLNAFLAVQHRLEPVEHEHPLQYHSPSIERSLYRLHGSARYSLEPDHRSGRLWSSSRSCLISDRRGECSGRLCYSA